MNMAEHRIVSKTITATGISFLVWSCWALTGGAETETTTEHIFHKHILASNEVKMHWYVRKVTWKQHEKLIKKCEQVEET